jgi:hypothetical protein
MIEEGLIEKNDVDGQRKMGKILRDSLVKVLGKDLPTHMAFIDMFPALIRKSDAIKDQSADGIIARDMIVICDAWDQYAQKNDNRRALRTAEEYRNIEVELSDTKPGRAAGLNRREQFLKEKKEYLYNKARNPGPVLSFHEEEKEKEIEEEEEEKESNLYDATPPHKRSKHATLKPPQKLLEEVDRIETETHKEEHDESMEFHDSGYIPQEQLSSIHTSDDCRPPKPIKVPSSTITRPRSSSSSRPPRTNQTFASSAQSSQKQGNQVDLDNSTQFQNKSTIFKEPTWDLHRTWLPIGGSWEDRWQSQTVHGPNGLSPDQTTNVFDLERLSNRRSHRSTLIEADQPWRQDEWDRTRPYSTWRFDLRTEEEKKND